MVIVLLAAVLASIAAWAPRKTWVRVNALVITLLIMPIGFLQVTEMLSRPKPANYECLRRHVDKVTVLSASFREKQAIYLWVRFDGDTKPRYYSLPWSNRLAENLQESSRKRSTRTAMSSCGISSRGNHSTIMST